MMPLKDKQNNESKISINYKARLERKLYLAQESPEPVFDISDCNLKTIPNNVFALCRVLRKEALYMQKNNLLSLTCGGTLADLKFLKVLNISENKLKQLSSNINELECLEVFDVSQNELLELPESIGELKNLMCLNVSHNNLKQLPNSIGNCKNMEILNLSYNVNLKQLPVSLGRLHYLTQLDIDSTMTYPPKEICDKGISEILKFLSKELKEDFEVPSTSAKVRKSIPNFDSLQEKLELHEKLKQEKQNERLRLERELMDQNKKEIEIHQKLKDNKQKLLQDVKSHQQSLDAELTKLQERKSIDRVLLIQLCQDEEKKSNEVVNKILSVKKNLPAQYSYDWESERKADEAVLLNKTNQSRDLERKEILVSMEKLMRDEILKAQRMIADRRLLVVRSLASEISEQNDTLENLFKKRLKDKVHLIDTLLQNEELQKSAVASLLEKSDAASWELAKQISIVESQLAEITRLEMSKRKLESECQITELSNNRMALTELLMNLFDQQAERRKQLIDTIRKMETLRESIKNSETFWMEQYDKLLNSRSHEMVKFLEAVDPQLIYELFINGVFQYLPLLKEFILNENELKNLNEAVLIKLDVKNAEDRNKILRVIKSFLESQRSRQFAPTAPLHEEPSAPLIDNANFSKPISASYLVPDECVICMETKPNVIFVPCGHICCCYKCFKSVTLCPLCRKPIDAVHERVEQF